MTRKSQRKAFIQRLEQLALLDELCPEYDDTSSDDTFDSDASSMSIDSSSSESGDNIDDEEDAEDDGEEDANEDFIREQFFFIAVVFSLRLPVEAVPWRKTFDSKEPSFHGNGFALATGGAI